MFCLFNICNWPTRPYLFFAKLDLKASKAANCLYQINLHRISLTHPLKRVGCKICSLFLPKKKQVKIRNSQIFILFVLWGNWWENLKVILVGYTKSPHRLSGKNVCDVISEPFPDAWLFVCIFLWWWLHTLCT